MGLGNRFLSGGASDCDSSISGVENKSRSIDVLVTIAVVGAFIIRNYEEAAIVTFLFLFGAFGTADLKQDQIRNQGTHGMAPETALKLIAGAFEEVDVEEVEVGDVLLVKTGAKVPVDGVVQAGEGHANEASLSPGKLFRLKKSPAQRYMRGRFWKTERCGWLRKGWGRHHFREDH